MISMAGERLRKDLKIGDNVKITQHFAGSGKKARPVCFKGEVIDVSNPSFFDISNGKWRESFRYNDVGLSMHGIRVEVLE